jgi:nitric oxide reductase NorQ protein
MHEIEPTAVLESETFKIEKEPYYLPQAEEVELFQAAYENKLPVMLVGPTGSGKTRLVEYMAWACGQGVCRPLCHRGYPQGFA